jgi:mono/diheme cytochrome c family protein
MFAPRRASAFVAVLGLTTLAACGGGDSASSNPPATADAPAATVAAGPDGAQLYGRCATCHQPNGAGLPGAFPPLAGSEWVTGDPATPIRIVLHGMQGEVSVAGQSYNGIMLPYGGTGDLNDAEVAAVLTYVRSSFGNSASAITAEQVAEVRAATSARTTPWTAAELRAM